MTMIFRMLVKREGLMMSGAIALKCVTVNHSVVYIFLLIKILTVSENILLIRKVPLIFISL